MIGKILGGMLLVVGTSIGAGMLALPTATAAGGFYHVSSFMLLAWVIMTFGALLILEVNLAFPADSNLVSMARHTLGRTAQVITWISYLLLFYSLLCAYIAGGSDILQHMLTLIHINLPEWIAIIVFVVVLGFIVTRGVAVVDVSNRFLMIVKFAAFILLIISILPLIHPVLLHGGGFGKLSDSELLVITSFGFASVVPTLRSYFNSNVKALRITIIGGSLLSLVIYVLWILAVQGSIVSQGAHGLIAMGHSPDAASALTNALSYRLNNPLINYGMHTFAAICMLTSFLGVSIGLTDFLADGFKVKKVGKARWGVATAAFLPPLLIILLYPGAFIIGLTYAGICCVLLLVLLPALMAWASRRRVGDHQYRLFGGKTLLFIEILLGVYLLVYGVMHL